MPPVSFLLCTHPILWGQTPLRKRVSDGYRAKFLLSLDLMPYSSGQRSYGQRLAMSLWVFVHNLRRVSTYIDCAARDRDDMQKTGADRRGRPSANRQRGEWTTTRELHCLAARALLLNAEVLGFLIAGLLVSCASSASITWELNASRRRPAFSSHLLAPFDSKSPNCLMHRQIVIRRVV